MYWRALVITGYLNDDTPFEGSDAIRIVLLGEKGQENTL
jgi:hypothetical protein